MDNPTNAALSKQIETVAQTVANIYEQMATRDEMHTRFEAVDAQFAEVNTRLDRIEQSVEHHGTDIDRLTDDVRVLKTTAGIL